MRLRTQVVSLGVGIAALVVVLAAIPLALLMRSEAYDTALQRASETAQNAADYVSSGTYDPTLVRAYLARLNGRESGVAPVLVELKGGARIGAPLPPDVLKAAGGTAPPASIGGDHDHDNGLGKVSEPQTGEAPGGRVVQVFCQTSGGGARVVAYVRDDEVNAIVRERYLLVLAAAAVLLLVAFGASELTGRRLARPLQRTAETATALSSGDLSARAPIAGPQEVAAVAIELNALADRISELLLHERENAADLSHRLRTPLTALRLAAEHISDPLERDEVEAHVDGMQRTLTSVIRAARQGDRDGLHPRCDAVVVVRERADFWRPLAEDQGREFEVEVPSGSLWVRANAADLGAAVDALLENVIAHTEEGIAFRVRLAPTPDGAVLDVSDEGPGIGAVSVTRGRSDRGSSGLGLDIARRAAESGGGRLEVVPGLGGHVRLTLLADSQRLT